MRILVLEDDPSRVKKIKQELVGFVVDFSDNVSDAINLIETYQYDLMFLDHDLGGKQMVNSSQEGTGYQFAKAIAISRLNKGTTVIIHSCNPAGAANMQAILLESVCIPFINLNIAGIVKSIQK